jgi:hypothetical protein
LLVKEEGYLFDGLKIGYIFPLGGDNLEHYGLPPWPLVEPVGAIADRLQVTLLPGIDGELLQKTASIV